MIGNIEPNAYSSGNIPGASKFRYGDEITPDPNVVDNSICNMLGLKHGETYTVKEIERDFNGDFELTAVDSEGNSGKYSTDVFTKKSPVGVYIIGDKTADEKELLSYSDISEDVRLYDNQLEEISPDSFIETFGNEQYMIKNKTETRKTPLNSSYGFKGRLLNAITSEGEDIVLNRAKGIRAPNIDSVKRDTKSQFSINRTLVADTELSKEICNGIGITPGKAYRIVASQDAVTPNEMISIINDYGKVDSYSKDMFLTENDLMSDI
jgi:hypothetical protein